MELDFHEEPGGIEETLVDVVAAEISGRYCLIEYKMTADAMVCVVYCPSAYQTAKLILLLTMLSEKGYSTVGSLDEISKLCASITSNLELKNAFKVLSDSDVTMSVEWTPVHDTQRSDT